MVRDWKVKKKTLRRISGTLFKMRTHTVYSNKLDSSHFLLYAAEQYTSSVFQFCELCVGFYEIIPFIAIASRYKQTNKLE